MSRRLRPTGRWSGYYSSAIAAVQQECLVWPSGCGKNRKAEMLCFFAGVMPTLNWVVSSRFDPIQSIRSGHNTRLFHSIESDCDGHKTKVVLCQTWQRNYASGGLSCYASRLFRKAYFKKATVNLGKWPMVKTIATN